MFVLILNLQILIVLPVIVRFHKGISAHDAIDILEKEPNGSFLFRPSSRYDLEWIVLCVIAPMSMTFSLCFLFCYLFDYAIVLHLLNSFTIFLKKKRKLIFFFGFFLFLFLQSGLFVIVVQRSERGRFYSSHSCAGIHHHYHF